MYLHLQTQHTMHARHRQVSGAEKVLYGHDDVLNAPEVIIVEGEMDKLSLEEAGFRNVVSVPDGAPARVKARAHPPAHPLFLLHVVSVFHDCVCRWLPSCLDDKSTIPTQRIMTVFEACFTCCCLHRKGSCLPRSRIASLATFGTAGLCLTQPLASSSPLTTMGQGALTAHGVVVPTRPTHVTL